MALNVSLLNVLKPAPFMAEVQDPAVIKSQYRYWRIRIFYGMYIGYIFYYFSRKSFTFITPFLCSDLGFDKAQIGILASVLALVYGVSKFMSGVLCDRSNPRYFMAMGLILTGILNILFGFSSSLWAFVLIWGLNGWFQGWGWQPCAKLLTYWFSLKERGTWWSLCTTSHTVGGFAIAYFAAYLGQQYGWRVAMWMSGIVCIVVGFFVVNRLRDVPESLGLPPIEEEATVESQVVSSATEPNVPEIRLSVKQILIEQLLNNKYVWMLSISYFFVYLIRSAVNDWGPIYLVETKGYTPFVAAGCISWFEVGGFFGLLFAGWGSDYWFQGRRVPLTVLFSIGLMVSLFGFWTWMPEHFLLESCVVAAIGFFIFGPQMLIGLAAAEMVDKKAVSTSNGFVSGVANLGSAAAGYPLMKVTAQWGWEGFVVALTVCSAIIILITLPMWASRTTPILTLEPLKPEPNA